MVAGWRKIAFLSRRDGERSHVVNADGSRLQRRPFSAKYEFDPPGPDGRKIAFARLTRWNGRLFVMNADGSGQRRLTYAKGWSAAEAPLNTRWADAAFSTHNDGTFDLYVINATAAASGT